MLTTFCREDGKLIYMTISKRNSYFSLQKRVTFLGNSIFMFCICMFFFPPNFLLEIVKISFFLDSSMKTEIEFLKEEQKKLASLGIHFFFSTAMWTGF